MTDKLTTVVDVAVRNLHSLIEKRLQEIFPTEASLAAAKLDGLEIVFPPASINPDTLKMEFTAELRYPYDDI